MAAACRKGTSIDGLVQDALTGAPIADARVDMEVLIDLGLANSRNSSLSFTTDQDGRFSYEGKDILAFYYTGISADGYGGVLYDYPALNAKECNNPVYKLTPRDGVLKVQMENISGTSDSLFFTATNDCDYLYYHFAYGQKPEFYPLLQGVNEYKAAYFKTCRGKPTYLKWSFDAKFTMAQKDTLEIGMEDTTFYQFKY